MVDYDEALEPFDRTLQSIGDRARQLRVLRNLTQEELAERSGVGTMTVRRFEKTGHVSIENALRIAFAAGVEDGFHHLFELPKYSSLDEALATSKTRKRQRVRKRK